MYTFEFCLMLLVWILLEDTQDLNIINKAVRDGTYIDPPHASAWQRSY